MNLNRIRLDETNKEINQLMIYDSIFIRILKKEKKKKDPTCLWYQKADQWPGQGRITRVQERSLGIMHGVTMTAAGGRG